jgi:hypothetical protein
MIGREVPSLLPVPVRARRQLSAAQPRFSKTPAVASPARANARTDFIVVGIEQDEKREVQRSECTVHGIYRPKDAQGPVTGSIPAHQQGRTAV